MRIDADAIAALRLGRFQLECLHMKLERNHPDGPVYEGPGRIEQDPDHNLRFTLYASGAQPFFLPELPAGAIIPPEHYWTLTATDYEGIGWQCAHVILEPGWSGPGGGSILSAQLPLLESRETEQRQKEGSAFHGYIFRDLKLPANQRTVTRMERDTEWSEGARLDSAITDVGSIHFLLHQAPDQLRVSAYDPTGELHPHFAERVREALQFVAAYPASWAATIETSSLERRVYIRGRSSPQLQPRIQAPIPNNLVGAEVAVWKLFGAYFAYVCRNADDEVHRLSAEWNEVLRSGLASLEAEALICSIAVESTCRYLEGLRPSGPARPESGPALWRDQVDAFLDGLGCPDRMRRRVRGCFNRMGRRDHTDLLLELVQSGAVDPGLVEAWGRWRHIMAHGDREAQRQLQEVMNACDALVTLLYQLYFHAIGYAGPFRDFSETGWRLRQYPLTAAAAGSQGPL